MTDQPFMPAPGSFALVQGADNEHKARLIGQWMRANEVDPGTVNGITGVRADYAGRQLIWFDLADGTRRTAPLLVEPTAEVLAAGRSGRANDGGSQ
jgi:hypothetical protein